MDKFTRTFAISLDNQDELSFSRDFFHIPTRNHLKDDKIESFGSDEIRDSSLHCTYLCGNSLGLQPRLASSRIEQYLRTWACLGVKGHWKQIRNSPLPKWLDADMRASESIAPIVGALPSEVAVMQTLTANLHLLMSAFYKPVLHGRHKIIIEGQAFPSDHFVAESQIKNHGFETSTSLVTINPQAKLQTLSTADIISLIEQHGSSAAILLLPGIQYYTGQYFDIPTINAAARKFGIFVIWDLAHAVGNVDLKLHDWNVDAGVWCNYKYLNSGPGAIGGLFIHERHSQVSDSNGEIGFVDRLSGWWGSEKNSRFAMDNKFRPMPGAAGFQLSNPSILDLTSVTASLEVFGHVCQWQNQDQSREQGISPLRKKSIKLTNYLESSLENIELFKEGKFCIITPNDPKYRGAQLSLKLETGLLNVVMKELENRGVIVDERHPDVIRVAPTPLYNTFEDCWLFVEAFHEALMIAIQTKNRKIKSKGIIEPELIN